VHGNEPALRAVLADLDRLGVERLLCLGDLVGYGADPGPVVDLLAARGAAAVAGNHDYASVGRTPLDWFNPYARRAAEWTSERLTADQTRFLARLPLTLEEAGALLVHSSPRNPETWPYLLSAEDGAEVLSAFAQRICFLGHSHLPAIWRVRADDRLEFERGPRRAVLSPAERYLVNVGSVGQPRDGDPHAACAVWDLDEQSVEIRRVPYDVQEARRRIHAAGLPQILGDRLLRGR
jgi:diadenosine tetraphosphatase ApaH/serine/threonine PP2A family protein phosphatase